MSKTIVFDFDGTLADSFALNIEVFCEISGKSHLTQEQIAIVRQKPLSKISKELGVPLWRLPKIVKQAPKRLNKRINELHTFEGIPDVLHKLRSRGHHLLIMSSNSEENIRAFLASNNLDRCFGEIYGSVGLFSKPRALRRIVKKGGFNPKDCYYVGDEVRDITAARKIGMPTIAVSWGYQDAQALARYKPLAIAKKPSELLKLLQ